jgi:hypothetical protein
MELIHSSVEMPRTKTELGNCPCCGGNASLVSKFGFYIQCGRCRLQTRNMRGVSRDDALVTLAREWNRRKELN